jgi:Hydrogenase/urease accessory protein
MIKTSRNTLLLAALLFAPALAQAHHAEFMRDKPLLQGISMPIHGLDHMLVAIAVGLIAAQIGGRALWAAPAVFTLAMLGGGIANLCGVPIPFVEQGILASVAIFGALLAWRTHVSFTVILLIIGLFAALHGNVLIANDGYVHFFPPFIAGCLISALALQALGIGIGLAMNKIKRFPALRYAGFAMLTVPLLITAFPSLNNVVINLLERSH